MVFSLFFSLSNWMSLMLVFFGIIWSLVSVSVFGVWIGMEISFIGVIGLLGGSSYEESESLVKYFIVQVLGSSLIMMSIMLMYGGSFLYLIEFGFVLGLFLKLGLFPFHFWVASVASGMSWMSCFLVLVVQKVIPVWIVSNLCFSKWGMSFLELSAVLTCLVGCVGGLMMLHFRVLLGYSSLVHMSFMVVLGIFEMSSFLIYFLVYFFINLSLMVSLWVVSIYSFFDVLKSKMVSSLGWLSLYLMSLSGVPPFLGSFLKVFFLLKCWSKFSLLCVALLFSSAVSMFFYLSFFMSMYFSFGKSCWVKEGSGGFEFSLNYLLFMVSVFVNVAFGLGIFSLSGLF
uniref:NADH-ubiquinone oxidoreductase chain 2 n=1 Tax=Villorita cyprinoides TaxID=1176411 RepID=A0A7L7YVU5_9BIVA|nr:NADH dehydrogenase subunit 2 [Villorita cyprinoides]QOD40735.1 NADH dehydrogenase subunit 2 [Villorita cyprinoides]